MMMMMMMDLSISILFRKLLPHVGSSGCGNKKPVCLPKLIIVGFSISR